MTQRRDPSDLDARSVYAHMAATIGPVLTETAVMALTGKTAADLDGMRAKRQILSAVTSDGHRVYPAAQFEADDIVEGLAETLAVLAVGRIDDWTLLLWFTAPEHDYLKGLSPLDWLAQRRDPRQFRASTNATAARWTG